ncbi:hypothetical protein RND81_10G007500 [Saponaria officinalis]|uniref:CCHC-type domain-containing protein n=1 Tax=Saponaria officinalis TaxID=3572 RepID=A0AAW1HZ84_SAPOF
MYVSSALLKLTTRYHYHVEEGARVRAEEVRDPGRVPRVGSDGGDRVLQRCDEGVCISIGRRRGLSGGGGAGEEVNSEKFAIDGGDGGCRGGVSPAGSSSSLSNKSLVVMTFISTRPHRSTTALIDAITGQRVSYTDLWRVVHSVSHSLSLICGVRKGHVVLILSPNSIDFPIVCLSVMSLGALITSTSMPEIVDNETLAEVQRKRNKWENDDYICRGHILNEESLRAQDGGKEKGKDVMGSFYVNMMEKGEGSKNKFKGKKRPFNNTNDGSGKAPKGPCWICGKTGHLKLNCKVGKHKKKKGASTHQGGQGSNDQGPPTNQGHILDYGFNSVVNYVPLISEAFYVQDDVVAWWIDSGATNHVCKDRHWFKDYELVKDGSVLYMGNESTALIVGRGTVVLEFSSGNVEKLCNVLHVPGIKKNLVSGSCLCKLGYKQVYESNKDILSILGESEYPVCGGLKFSRTGAVAIWSLAELLVDVAI